MLDICCLALLCVLYLCVWRQLEASGGSVSAPYYFLPFSGFFFNIVLLQKQTTVYKTTLLQIEGNILALFAQIRIQIWSDLQNIFW